MRRADRRLSTGLVLAAALLLAGCLRAPVPPSDSELAAELGLSASTPIHRVHLAGTGAATRVLPSETRLDPGGWIQMVVEDHRVYAVRFLVDEMADRSAEFLRETGQTASPPMARQGSRFVVSFVDAPPGSYPFVVDGFGDPVRGVVHVGTGE